MRPEQGPAEGRTWAPGAKGSSVWLKLERRSRSEAGEATQPLPSQLKDVGIYLRAAASTQGFERNALSQCCREDWQRRAEDGSQGSEAGDAGQGDIQGSEKHLDRTSGDADIFWGVPGMTQRGDSRKQGKVRKKHVKAPS